MQGPQAQTKLCFQLEEFTTEFNASSYVFSLYRWNRYLSFQKSDYMLKLNKSLLRNYDDVMNNLSHKEEQVVDARPIDSPSVVDGE